MTPLDQAHAAMQAAPEETALRLAWFDRLAASELFLLLEAEPQGDKIEPCLFEVEGQNFVLVFDRVERLVAFVDGAGAPYAALSGRAMAPMLASAGLGMAVNSGSDTEMVLDPDAVTWFAETLADAPEEIEQRLSEILAPGPLPDALLQTLDARLASAEGRAQMAYLVQTRDAAGALSHMLAFINTVPGAEPALAQLVRDALAFSGLDAAVLDVAFFAGDHAVTPRLARVGLRFDLPLPAMPEAPAAPGRDPDKPPRLR